MVYYDPRKPKPWPIRLLNKWGVADDTKATRIVVVTALLLLLITAVMYFNLLSDETAPSPTDIENNLEAERLPTI